MTGDQVDGRQQMLISGGMYSRSSLAVLSFSFDDCDVQIDFKEELGDEFFGEGISVVNDAVYQLTWLEDTIIEWAFTSDDPIELSRVEDHELHNTGLQEGWGLSYNQADGLLYGSDGSEFLYAIDPDTLENVSTTEVTVNGNRLEELNELEVLPGGEYILANVYYSNHIHLIEIATGEVKQSWDL